MEQFWLVHHSSRGSAGLIGFEAHSSNVLQISKLGTPVRHDSYADDTRAPLMQPAPRGATHDKLTAKRLPACSGCLLLPRASRFVCHRRATVQMFREWLSVQHLRL